MMISLGFYISKDSLGLVELSFSGSQPQLLFRKELFFKDPSSEEEKQSLISKEIQRIESKYKGKNIRLCYGLSQSLVSGFFVEFPFKEKFKILKTLPFEVEDKTPFQLDRALFDARICKIEKDNKSSVLVFVTLEENVKEFVTFLKPLKKPIHLLSCSASALANLLEAWNAPLSKAQNLKSEEAYVYLGLENSLFFLYKEGFLSHVSVMNWGCYGMIEEMAKVYKLSKEKAYEEFFSKAFILTQTQGFTKEQKFFSNLIKKQMGSLIPEIKLLRMSLETAQTQPLSNLSLFGPGSKIKNLSLFLTDELELPVSKLKAYAPFPQFDLQQRPLADIALGLALEGLKKSPYTGLNFLQSSKKSVFSFYPKKWRKTALAFLFSFIVFFAYAFIRQFESANILNRVEEIFIDYGKKIAGLRESAVRVEAIKDFLAVEKEKRKAEKTVQEILSEEQPMDHLQKIVQKIGSAENWNLSLQYVKISAQKVEMRGQINQADLGKFKALLQSLSAGSLKEYKTESSALSADKSASALELPSSDPAQASGKAEKESLSQSSSTVDSEKQETKKKRKAEFFFLFI